MINYMAEAKTLHRMKEFLQNFDDKYSLSFYKNDFPVISQLASFRFNQGKIKEGKFQLFPQQLILLTRYYHYHCPENNGNNKEKTIELMKEWINVLYDGIRKNTKEKLSEDSMFMNRNFSIPLFDRFIPFDVIIQEGINAGRIPENTEYPSPDGLPLLMSSSTYKLENTEKGEARNKEIENFWRTQLYSLSKFDNQKLENTKKYSDSKAKMRAGSRRTETIFILSLWYAARFREYSEKCPIESFSNRIPINLDYMRRAFMEFSSNNAGNVFKQYSRHIIFTPGDISTFTFLFADPKKIEVPDDFELPRIESLDNGYRIHDVKGFFYCIKLSNIANLLFDKDIVTVCDRETIFSGKKDYDPGNNDDDDENEENKKEPEQYYCFSAKYSNAPELEREIKKIFQEEYIYAEKCMNEVHAILFNGIDGQKRAAFFKLLRDEEPDADKSEAVRAVMNNINIETHGKKAFEFAEKACSSKSHRNISENIFKLMKNLWKQKTKTDKKKYFKDFIENLPEKTEYSVITSEEPCHVFAELLARAMTMIFSMHDDWTASGVPDKFLLFYPAAHLCIPQKYLDKEREFINILKTIPRNQRMPH